jgi:hypothetical protein
VRALALTCTVLAAALGGLALLLIVGVDRELADREVLSAAFPALCFAAPFAIAGALLSLLNRRKWSFVQILVSFVVLVMLALVGAWWAAIQ